MSFKTETEALDGLIETVEAMIDVARLADITVAALREAGRPDLAELVQFFQDDDGSWYLEPIDDVNDDDLAIMVKAEQLAAMMT